MTQEEEIRQQRTGQGRWQLAAQLFSEQPMYARLEKFAQAEGLAETARALPYMRGCHAGQTRRPPRGQNQGAPYIVHPLTMACQACAMGIGEDAVLAAALLHDVCEDCGVAPGQLPFSAPVRQAVALLTKDARRFRALGRQAALAEYHRGIRENGTAMLVKCLDRCNNLSTMAASFTPEKMAAYIAETEEFILPMLPELARRCPRWSHAAFLLRYQMLGLLETQKAFLLQSRL